MTDFKVSNFKDNLIEELLTGPDTQRSIGVWWLMENLLRSKEYWSLVEDGVAAAPIGASQEQLKINEESKLKDLKAKNYSFKQLIEALWRQFLTRVQRKPFGTL
ncbi:retrovirus-related Pol polyprotein from transposon TNT 1-94 [Sesbania bispinosa]|nr:retrovirus-related Pol polyprotein from transposon TNT 1-94 [Sesbania bispinosa]